MVTCIFIYVLHKQMYIYKSVNSNFNCAKQQHSLLSAKEMISERNQSFLRWPKIISYIKIRNIEYSQKY